jgi:hypothetical protein
VPSLRPVYTPSHSIRHVDVAELLSVGAGHQRAAPFVALTDQSGMLWITIGTDSGFESTTSIYYDQVVIRALEVETYQSDLPLIRS